MATATKPAEVVRLGGPTPADMAEIVETVSSCIQCGTCSGSCPTAPFMDYTPRQIMHMAQQNMKDAILSSRAIWLCATCFSCTVRCPRSISVADVLARLRGMAAAQGYRETTGMTFNRSFLTIVRRYGRMFEPELLIRYHLRQQLPRLLGMAPLGWTLFRKGKVGLLPDRLKPARGGADVQRIFDRVGQLRQEQAAAAAAAPAQPEHKEG